MIIDEFIRLCERTFGGGKIALMPDQRAAYFQKLERFNSEQLDEIYSKVLELTAHFPKIKDIYDAARELGFLSDALDASRNKPHVWQETECRFCAGSGLMAAMYEQEFEHGDSGAVQVLKLVHVGPYHRSSDRRRAQPFEVLAVFRCKCSAGDVDTIQRGLPRWSDAQPIVRKRAWG
jgi:hypothetical protein